MIKFRNQSGGYYLQGLFYEQTLADKSTVVYTLKEVDHEGYPSLYRLFMEHCILDPTEYTFAKKCLDGWNHWARLCECTWFQEYLTKWRRELELAVRSRALVNIIHESRTASKNSFMANKFLLEGNWKQDRKAGRPSKDDIRKEAYEQVSQARKVSEDAERLGLN